MSLEAYDEVALFLYPPLNTTQKTYFLSIIMLFMIACSSIEKDAKKQMESTFKEIAKDPSSVKLTNTNIVFSNDSLCIIHVDCSAKNGIGTEIKRTCEYIFIKSNKKSCNDKSRFLICLIAFNGIARLIVLSMPV